MKISELFKPIVALFSLQNTHFVDSAGVNNQHKKPQCSVYIKDPDFIVKAINYQNPVLTIYDQSSVKRNGQYWDHNIDIQAIYYAFNIHLKKTGVDTNNNLFNPDLFHGFIKHNAKRAHSHFFVPVQELPLFLELLINAQEDTQRRRFFYRSWHAWKYDRAAKKFNETIMRNISRMAISPEIIPFILKIAENPKCSLRHTRNSLKRTAFWNQKNKKNFFLSRAHQHLVLIHSMGIWPTDALKNMKSLLPAYRTIVSENQKITAISLFSSVISSYLAIKFTRKKQAFIPTVFLIALMGNGLLLLDKKEELEHFVLDDLLPTFIATFVLLKSFHELGNYIEKSSTIKSAENSGQLKKKSLCEILFSRGQHTP
jgi:hypothetical protein